MPWEHAGTWNVTRREPCDRIVTTSGAAQGQPPAYCSWYGVTCCTPQQAAAAQCAAVHAVAGLSLASDSLNGSMSDPALMSVLERLHACGLAELNLEANDMSGELLGPWWARLANLEVLNLANNWLGGTIPPELGSLKKLRRLELGTNFLHGSIGTWVGGLRELQVLSLGANGGTNPAPPGGPGVGDGVEGEAAEGLIGSIPEGLAGLTQLVELDLESNALTGTVPPRLCSLGKELQMLSLRGNYLHGPVRQVANCMRLVALNLGGNAFTGSLPATAGWLQLVKLDLSHNEFEGTIPLPLYQLPFLAYLDLSGNRLTGAPSYRINLLSYLVELDLSENRLSGRMVEDFFFLPQLQRLNLANNSLTGTLAPSIGLAAALQELDITNNPGIVGPVPDQAGSLQLLSSFHMAGSGMSCAPAAAAHAAHVAGGEAPPPYRCAPQQLLPCFLAFQPFSVPLADDSHMQCSPVVRKPPDRAACGRDGAGAAADGGDGDIGSSGGAPANVLQAWDLGPAYFQYQGCSCLKGYAEEWSQAGTLLLCAPEPRAPPLPPWAWALVLAGALAAAGLLAAVLLGRRLEVARARWALEAEFKRKRAKGVPQGGEAASIVVTDIEAYSEMMRASPAHAVKALALHNAVLRKAAHKHAGHVLEQEGDSWRVAFREAADAVAFCLQAQQALRKVNWPLGIFGAAASGSFPGGAGAGGRLFGSLTSSGLEDFTLDDGLVLPVRTASAAAAALRADSLGLGGSGIGAHAAAASAASSHSEGIVSRVGSIMASGDWATRIDSAAEAAGNSAGSDGAAGPGAVAWRPRRTHSSLFSLLLRPGGEMGGGLGSFPSGRLFYGLRVRMGVASGVLPAGSLASSSPVFAQAMAVSAMAHGGQVLVDAATFDSVKDRREELGAVDHHGYAENALLARGRAGALGPSARCCKGACLRSSGVAGKRTLAVLDMGEYEGPPRVIAAAVLPTDAGAAGDGASGPGRLAPRPGANSAAAGAAGPGGEVPGGNAGPTGGNTLVTGAEGDADTSAAAAAAPGKPWPSAATAAPGIARLRVYSILPASLANRAKASRGELELRDRWRQVDRGFFDAPGATLAASLSPLEGPKPLSAMPVVTFVVAGSEGGGDVVQAIGTAAAASAARLLRAAMLAALDAVPGGYLCREQGAELRYMLAFATPDAALKWCMVVQEALLYAPWPPQLLALPALVERRASVAAAGGGRSEGGDGPSPLLFRGPRLKMGVCQGLPRLITPDHLGRADYFGEAVNTAARFMAVAAHGGQIVCADGLAMAVIRGWQAAPPSAPADAAGLNFRSAAADASTAVQEGLSTPQPLRRLIADDAAAAAQCGSVQRGDHSAPPTTGPPGPMMGGAAAPQAGVEAESAARSCRVPSASSDAGLSSSSNRLPSPIPSWTYQQQRQLQQRLQTQLLQPALAQTQALSVAEEDGQRSSESQTPVAKQHVVQQLQQQQERPQVAQPAEAHPQSLLRQLRVSVTHRRSVESASGGTISPPPHTHSYTRPHPPGASAGRALSVASAPSMVHARDQCQRGAAFGLPGGWPQRSVRVVAANLGGYVFKGTDLTEVVTVWPSPLAGRAALLPRAPPNSSKGRCIVPRTGVAGTALVWLPDVLEARLRTTFLEAAHEVLDVAAAAQYEAWLRQELARRQGCPPSK